MDMVDTPRKEIRDMNVIELIEKITENMKERDLWDKVQKTLMEKLEAEKDKLSTKVKKDYRTDIRADMKIRDK